MARRPRQAASYPAPAALGPEGRAYWLRIVPLLLDRGTLTALHLEALEAMCGLWENYQMWRKYLAGKPERWIFKSQSGFDRESPQAKELKTALNDLHRMWAKFGLTPHAEGLVGTKEKPTARMGLRDVAKSKTAGDAKNRPVK